MVASLQLMRLYRLIGKEFRGILTEDKRIKAMSILARPCPRIWKDLSRMETIAALRIQIIFQIDVV